jgi:hypothetical protein
MSVFGRFRHGRSRSEHKTSMPSQETPASTRYETDPRFYDRLANFERNLDAQVSGRPQPQPCQQRCFCDFSSTPVTFYLASGAVYPSTRPSLDREIFKAATKSFANYPLDIDKTDPEAVRRVMENWLSNVHLWVEGLNPSVDKL